MRTQFTVMRTAQVPNLRTQKTSRKIQDTGNQYSRVRSKRITTTTGKYLTMVVATRSSSRRVTRSSTRTATAKNTNRNDAARGVADDSEKKKHMKKTSTRKINMARKTTRTRTSPRRTVESNDMDSDATATDSDATIIIWYGRCEACGVPGRYNCSCEECGSESGHRCVAEYHGSHGDSDSQVNYNWY
jgi:hypothetical protein